VNEWLRKTVMCRMWLDDDGSCGVSEKVCSPVPTCQKNNDILTACRECPANHFYDGTNCTGASHPASHSPPPLHPLEQMPTNIAALRRKIFLWVRNVSLMPRRHGQRHIESYYYTVHLMDFSQLRWRTVRSAVL